jgi:hypothetical protein
MIKSLHQELGGEEAELDDDEDDPLIHRIRRECAIRVKDCEDRLKKSQTEVEMLSTLLDKTTQDLREAHEVADDAKTIEAPDPDY